MNKGIWLVLTVCMVLSLAVDSAYSRDNVASSRLGGVATFLDPGDQTYMGLWDNINDETGAGVNVDWLNYPFQATPTWQVTLPGAFGIDTGAVNSTSYGQLGRNIDDFVIEYGVNGEFSPVVSMRDYDYVSQSDLWFGPPYFGYSRTNANQDVVQVLEVDTIRVTEFNTTDVDSGPRPHMHPSINEIIAYNRDAGPAYTRPAEPTDVTLSSDGKTLTWDAVLGAVGYNVWISRAGVGSLSEDYFCVNQLPGPFSYLNNGMVTGTSYTLPLAWQGFAAGLYVVTSVDTTGTNSFYSAPATKEVGGGGGLTAEQVQAMIDASLAPVLESLEDLGDDISDLAEEVSDIQTDINTIIGGYNAHVHDKGSGSRNTTTPIPQIQ